MHGQEGKHFHRSDDSDDNFAIKSGLPIKLSDHFCRKEIGLPQMASTNILIQNIASTEGQEISIGL